MERKEKHIDEDTLHAWLDGALGPEEAARVEAHVNSCAACGAAAAEARGLVAAASRILTALDDIPGGVAPGGLGGTGAGRHAAPPRVDAARSRRSTGSVGQSSAAPSSTLAERRRRLWTGWPLRAAAAVLFVAAGSFAVIKQIGPRSVAVTHSATPTAPPSAPPAPSMAPVPRPDSAPAPLASRKQQPARERQAALAKKAPPAPAVAPESAPTVVYEDSSAARRAAPGPVTLTGRVVSAKTGEPVSQATVRLDNPPVTAATNANGDYALPVPSNQAGQPAKITVRRIGFESKIDSVTLAQAAATDTVHHDIALAPSTLVLQQQVVTGVGAMSAAKAQAAAAPRAAGEVRKDAVPTGPGCYTIDAPGLPSRIELGEHLRVLPPDSAAFPTAFWSPVGRIAVRIVLTDTSGTTREVRAMIVLGGLQGSFTRSDSATVVKPFAATRTGLSCR